MTCLSCRRLLRTGLRARFTRQARQAADNSDAIIAVSQSTASQIQQLLGVEPSRIHVVPHGVSTVAIPAAPGAAPRENLVLFVGVIQRRKNVGRLVQAFERLPPAGVWRWRAPPQATEPPKNCVRSRKVRGGPTSISWVTCPPNSSLLSTLAPASSRFPRSMKASACPSSKPWPTESPW